MPEGRKSRSFFRFFITRRFYYIGLLVLTIAASFFIIETVDAIRPTQFTVNIGDVSTQDILAPHSLTYQSKILTEQALQAAEQRILPVFKPADPTIARNQIEKLRVNLSYIDVVRNDPYANQDQKLVDLSLMENLRISRDVAERILGMNDARWQVISQESLNVLEMIMRNSIREDSLKDYQNRIVTLISFSIPQEQSSIITIIVSQFIVPNSLFSLEQTLEAKNEARKMVEPVNRILIAGETIIQRGQIITPLAYEALEQFDLIQPRKDYREPLATLLTILTLASLTTLYMNRRMPPIMHDLRSLTLTVFFFLVFLFSARVIIPNRTVIPYLFPLSAFGLTIGCLFNFEIGLLMSIIISVLTAFNLPNSYELVLFYAIPSIVGILVLGKGMRIGTFFWAGVVVGISAIVVLISNRLLTGYLDAIGAATLTGAALLNGIASASLALLFQFIFSQLLGLTTGLQLLEISRPDHPLSQFILQNAPGTYQHSLQVAILAEQAAERIKIDPLLVRVGAIYHDAGKALNPLYFIENQIPGKLNPHDELDPVISARTIIKHVADGVQLARKYHLPPHILDFIREHHGTSITRYQYARAVRTTGDNPEFVNPETFRYPGPRPQSKETALLMLADGVQARARAELPKDESEIRALVKKVIDYCQKEGQLDDTRLTLQDLNIILESFTHTLQNTYHPRIRYPEIPAGSTSNDIASSQYAEKS
ncbi:MAG TPA: HDIG domain-containing metalloprotein [Anaerolineaceae bacterium]